MSRAITDSIKTLPVVTFHTLILCSSEYTVYYTIHTSNVVCTMFKKFLGHWNPDRTYQSQGNPKAFLRNKLTEGAEWDYYLVRDGAKLNCTTLRIRPNLGQSLYISSYSSPRGPEWHPWISQQNSINTGISVPDEKMFLTRVQLFENLISINQFKLCGFIRKCQDWRKW